MPLFGAAYALLIVDKHYLYIVLPSIFGMVARNECFKVPNTCISSMLIALLKHEFVPVETQLLKASCTDFYAKIVFNLSDKTLSAKKDVILSQKPVEPIEREIDIQPKTVVRPNKKSMFRLMGLKILGRVGTHIFFNDLFFLEKNLILCI